MNRWVRYLLLISFWGPGGQLILAADLPATQARVAFAAFPPWAFKTPTGQNTGILVDYIRDLAQEAGLVLSEEEIPIPRLHHNMQHGKIDIFFMKEPEKDLSCCTSLGKAFDGETVIMGRKSGPIWNAVSTTPQSICRIALSEYNMPSYRMFDANSLDTCVRMVARDRLPFLIGERYTIMHLLQAQPQEVMQLFAEPVIVKKSSFYLFITKKLDHSPAGPLIRKAVARMNFANYIRRYTEPKP